MREGSGSELTRSILEMTRVGFIIVRRDEKDTISIFANSKIGETERMLTQKEKRKGNRMALCKTPELIDRDEDLLLLKEVNLVQL